MIISQDDMRSGKIWFLWSKPSNYQEKLRCQARDERTDGRRRKVENSAVFWIESETAIKCRICIVYLVLFYATLPFLSLHDKFWELYRVLWFIFFGRSVRQCHISSHAIGAPIASWHRETLTQCRCHSRQECNHTLPRGGMYWEILVPPDRVTQY